MSKLTDLLSRHRNQHPPSSYLTLVRESLGLRSQSLLVVKWEEMWDRELEEFGQSLDIVPFGCYGGALNVEFSPTVLKETVSNYKGN